MIKALIVDDEKLVRKGMIAIMPWSEYGIEVIGDVSSGEKALDFIRNNPVDLLITDLSMPQMSGLELVKSVRAIDPEIAIVVLTFHQDFDFIQQALREGVIDYILKTQLEKEEMGSILSRIVGRMSKNRRADASEQAITVNKIPNNSQKEDIHILMQKWHGTEWIFDDAKYNLLAEETLRKRPSIDAMETIFYSVRNEWDYKLPFILDKIDWTGNRTDENKSAVPCNSQSTDLSQNNELESWLKRLDIIRNAINAEVLKPQHCKEIVASIMKAIDYINNSEGILLKQEDVAKYCNMSRSYFSVCFKNVTGQSFYNYMKDSKIKKAQNLLLQTHKPVYWIAEKLGYQDEKYFSRMFLDRTGMLPSEFRNRLGNVSKG